MTAVDQKKETLSFQTEVKELLHLMINAIYSNKQIFLRELISNSSDAIDKLSFEALSDNALYENDHEVKIHVSFDKTKRTITIKDNGIGMSREEAITNLGTIAKSGTREFLSKLGDQAKDSKLIGQFGVGFYSSFIVAKKVEVETRRAGLTKEHGVRWTSEGAGDYTLENIEKADRGTTIILHLKEGEDEFLNAYTLRSIITKYSDHITVPIMMIKEKKEEDKDKPDEWEQINKAQALWTLPKNQVKDEEYQTLYKHISHDYENPLAWSHNRVEGRHEYYSLLYIPAKAPFNMWNREQKHGVKLYVKNVFIMDEAENLLPMYLRFVKGIIDSNDLPLNISREILQNNKIIENIKSASIKKILGLLEQLAKDDAAKYQTFWDAFGNVMKEGPAEDHENKEKIAKLLRFASTHNDEEKQSISFEDYVSRMKPDQDKIYYLTADSFVAAKHSPHLEVFRKNGIEVLLLSDRVDEWLVSHLDEFEGKKFASITQGDLDLGKLVSEEDKEKQQQEEKDFESVVKQLKEVLDKRVKEVKLTHRLTNSPACVVASEDQMGLQMQRIMRAAGQDFKAAPPVLEINPEHKIIINLKNEADDDRFKQWAHVLLDQAILAEGGQLDDAASYVQRLNQLLIGMM